MNFIICLVFLILLETGCSKKPAAETSTTAPSPSSTALTNPANGTVAPPSRGASIDAQMAEALDALTQAVRKYGAEKQRVPKTFEELVSAGYLSQVPQAPDGKKFIISEKRMEVQLVNR